MPPSLRLFLHVLLTQSARAPFPIDRAIHAWTAEVGTRGRSGALTWDVTLYRSKVEGELLSFNAVTGYPAAFFNVEDILHQGVEASLDWRLLDASSGTLTLRQTYAWSDFQFDGNPVYADNRLPVVPEYQYRVALKWSHSAGFHAEPVDRRITDVYVDYANTFKAPSYAPGWTCSQESRWPWRTSGYKRDVIRLESSAGMRRANKPQLRWCRGRVQSNPSPLLEAA